MRDILQIPSRTIFSRSSGFMNMLRCVPCVDDVLCILSKKFIIILRMVRRDNYNIRRSQCLGIEFLCSKISPFYFNSIDKWIGKINMSMHRHQAIIP